MRNITAIIKNKSAWEEPITVQVGYTDFDGEWVLDTCNHAGAVEEPVEHILYNPTKGDIDEWYSSAFVCNKCGAVNNGDGDWS